jgi:simple sugar transport system substrate-binding protein
MRRLFPAATLAAIVLTAAPLSDAAAQDVDTSCEGLNFVFFPGGPQGGPFASIVYNGARLAEEQTGCDVEYVWSEWNPEMMVRQFSQAIGRNPDGIAIMGHPGDPALGPLIDQAREKGIIVTSQNVALPESEGQYKAQGFGYVGAKNYTAGQNLASGLIDRCDVGEGDTAFVWGLLAQEARGQRTKGVIDRLEEVGVAVEYLEISDATNKDPAQGIPTFASFMASNPDVDIAVTDHGALTATLPAYLGAAGKSGEEICTAGFDLSAATVEGLQSGDIDVVLDQQPFLQGYLPIIQLYLTAKFGFAGMNIDTGAALITPDHVDAVAALAEAAIR